MLEKIKQNIETQSKALNVNVFFGTAESIFADIETKSKLNSNEKRDVFPALFVNSDYSLKNRVVKLNMLFCFRYQKNECDNFNLLTELLSNINIINGNDVNFDVLTNLTLTKIGGFSRNQIPANVPYTVKIILFDAELLIN